MNMKSQVSGIHHVSAFSSDLQRTTDFYTVVLGLHFIKKQAYWDNPEVNHVFFGTGKRMSQAILSFSPYEEEKQGRHGTAMVNTTTFSVSAKAMEFWLNRFEQYNVPYKHPQERFEGEVVVYFEDRDGLGLELVFNDKDQRSGIENPNIAVENALRGLYNVEIWERSYGRTETMLMQYLNHRLVAQKGDRFRYAVTDTPGNYVDVLFTSAAPKSFYGSGTVDRLAFFISDRDALFALREQIKKIDKEVSFIIDKKDLQSITFSSATGLELEVVSP
ncbi:MAG TPA: VOC family protein [Chitinophagaceae bacterium]|nr:VOC family protein [Chitinophagaceae bacterium]